MEAGETKHQVTDDLIFSIFQTAMSRPERERDEFIREACFHDSRLLAGVERRVRWEARLNGFLLTPVLTSDHTDHPFAEGDILLNRFRIIRVAGEGGMGVVYEAFDDKLGHRIALKCPRFEFRRRISPEAVKAIRVTHPNVCRVFEVHTAETMTGPVDFLTMEFVQGETLAERLRDAPARWLETQEGREIARQICAGLAAVHLEDVIHRDLKPGNIMLSTDATRKPRAVLMDFGIAQGTELLSGPMRGTPAYIAPELWKGQPATVQSDIYAVGVLLYQMASHRLPFPERTKWKVRLEEQPISPGVRPPVGPAILRCLHPDPDLRFHDVQELHQALRSSLTRRLLLGSAAALFVCLPTGKLLQEELWPSSTVAWLCCRPQFKAQATATYR